MDCLNCSSQWYLLYGNGQLGPSLQNGRIVFVGLNTGRDIDITWVSLLPAEVNLKCVQDVFALLYLFCQWRGVSVILVGYLGVQLGGAIIAILMASYFGTSVDLRKHTNGLSRSGHRMIWIKIKWKCNLSIWSFLPLLFYYSYPSLLLFLFLLMYMDVVYIREWDIHITIKRDNDVNQLYDSKWWYVPLTKMVG